ncbi:MAG: arylamine N-acetyltransferase family protein [Acetobacteraceae bacterium]
MSATNRQSAMSEPFDLDAYLGRIRWRGAILADYATLAGLLAAHIARIPFENFDVLLGRGVSLDLSALQAKLVGARRGGYCFEHATLFAAVLETIGFRPVRHAARVIAFRPPDQAARTHMFLSVTTEGVRYVVDPGFGLYASPLPLPLNGGGVPPGAPTHYIVPEGSSWVLYARRNEAMTPAWVSTLEAEHPIDFEVANHYTATHPDSHFMNSILASAVIVNGRVNVMNRNVTHISGGGAEKTELADRKALRMLVSRHFGFDLPELETMRVPAIPEWS